MSPRKAPPFQAIVWIALYCLMVALSAWHPADTLTWWLEIFPSAIGVVVLAATFRRFPLSPLLYWIILFHSAILYMGGHYTYAETPFPNLFGDLFGAGRNNFDKIGHFFQGVTPALLTRELLIRTSPLAPSKWLSFVSVSVALAFSAFYEFIEWWTAVLGGASSEAFLGTQGYVWDTQSDMFMALIGATVAIAALWKLQDRQIAKIRSGGRI
jgi:putative membrane protein